MRDAIVEAVRAAVEPKPWALALWEGGSASFGRLDADSDVDLCVAVEDAHVADGMTAVDAALDALAGVEDRWPVFPTTHVKPQTYFRLRGTAPLVDVAVLPRSTPPADRFVERRRHGTPRVVFDRAGFTADVPPDPAAWRERLRARVADLRGRSEMLGPLAMKSLRRGELAEAVAFYQAFVLNPLVEVLRLRHDPWRHDFALRYLRFDLPEDARREVYDLWFVAGPDDLAAKHARATARLRAELASMDVDAVPLP